MGILFVFLIRIGKIKLRVISTLYNDYIKKFYKTETDSISSEVKKIFKNSKVTIGNNIVHMEYTPIELDVIYDEDNKGNITENIEYAMVKFGSHVKDYTLNENIVVTKFFLNGNIYKFKNPYSNIWYIYDLDSKSALSYYADEDDFDYITEMYGITDWVNGLKDRKLSMNDLIQN